MCKRNKNNRRTTRSILGSSSLNNVSESAIILSELWTCHESTVLWIEKKNIETSSISILVSWRVYLCNYLVFKQTMIVRDNLSMSRFWILFRLGYQVHLTRKAITTFKYITTNIIGASTKNVVNYSSWEPVKPQWRWYWYKL